MTPRFHGIYTGFHCKNTSETSRTSLPVSLVQFLRTIGLKAFESIPIGKLKP